MRCSSPGADSGQANAAGAGKHWPALEAPVGTGKHRPRSEPPQQCVCRHRQSTHPTFLPRATTHPQLGPPGPSRVKCGRREAKKKCPARPRLGGVGKVRRCPHAPAAVAGAACRRQVCKIAPSQVAVPLPAAAKRKRSQTKVAGGIRVWQPHPTESTKIEKINPSAPRNRLPTLKRNTHPPSHAQMQPSGTVTPQLTTQFRYQETHHPSLPPSACPQL